jgi:1-deoxy-D-xylulose-5-phosphate reductoisomerase
MKKIVILGSTGSVGRQTLSLIKLFPEEFEVVGLTAGDNIELLISQMMEFQPKFIGCKNPDQFPRELLIDDCAILSPEEIVTLDEVDLVVAATVGTVALSPILKAIESSKNIVLSNKESIVMAGDLVTSLAKTYNVSILPVDSEPSAIWQCLRGENEEISRIIITASGGALRNKSLKELHAVTPEQALKHPTWTMGKKITIDSATLMNKGFEVIESKWLFNLPWNKIDVVIHHQSVIHSMVEFIDGSVKAQISPPDMRLPIQYALFYPQRVANDVIEKFNPSLTKSLTFEELDRKRYPCFDIALESGAKGHTYPAVLNAADEIAVDLFLTNKIKFTEIPLLVESVLSKHDPILNPSLENILMADEWARNIAREWRH